MYGRLMSLLAASLMAACVSAPEPVRRTPPASQAEAAAMAAAERLEALAHGGDAAAGKDAYEVCSACHLPSGNGRRDGAYPMLAGQHTTVLIKQIADIRARLRENRNMHAFAAELRGARDVADVAAYIASLCIPPGNGRYELPDGNSRITEGQNVYDKDCKDCHGPQGVGDREKGYPVLAGQHYRYLLRQMSDIRDGYRRNADPDMVKTIARHGDPALVSLSAYLASLPPPGVPCAAGKP
jgi:cytochrome c553